MFVPEAVESGAEQGRDWAEGFRGQRCGARDRIVGFTREKEKAVKEAAGEMSFGQHLLDVGKGCSGDEGDKRFWDADGLLANDLEGHIAIEEALQSGDKVGGNFAIANTEEAAEFVLCNEGGEVRVLVHLFREPFG